MTLTPAFKLVFLSVLGLTVLAMLLTCYMITVGGPPILIKDTVNGMLRENPEHAQWNAVMTMFSSTFKLGFGTMIGLVGGKVG